MDEYQSQPKFKIPKTAPIWVVVVLILAGFLVGLFFGGNAYLQNGKSVIRGIDPNATSTYGMILNKDGKIPDYLTSDVDFNLFWDVWDIINDKYYDQNIPETQMFYGALAGIVASLRDSHSIFLTKQDADTFQEELNGNFEGIGAEIGIRNEQLTVIAPLDESPALKAGLRAKDKILKIDDEDTLDMSLEEAVSKIRGEKGSEVILTIYRDGFIEAKDYTIVRDAINIKSVELEFKDGNIAYIKTRQFNNSTIPLLNDAIIKIVQRKDVRGIILDLRYNPGGYLQDAIDMAGEWIDNDTVVIEKKRDGQDYEYSSTKISRLAGIKTIILVNAGSASGSEIVAGALQDYAKATIVGEQTYGKGSVQEIIKLKDGSSIKLTIAKWYTPNGRSIDDEGVEPDVVVEMTEEDYNNFKDPQLAKALELIRN
ncbi:MAG TPA: S41 family peptidase [Patescibacteria group bacterium]|nr:S41 family peptidase [Patescibacteria group bacterium]